MSADIDQRGLRRLPNLLNARAANNPHPLVPYLSLVKGQADGVSAEFGPGRTVAGPGAAGLMDTRHLRVNQISINGGLLGELRRCGVFANGPIETALTLWGACSRSRNWRL